MAEQHGVTGFQVVATKIADGFFVPAAGVKALGSNLPTVNTVHVKGWEFGNHYRGGHEEDFCVRRQVQDHPQCSL